MNTLKTIYDKLAKTELKSNKIELNAIDDYYKKLDTKLGTAITNYENLFNSISKEKEKLKKLYQSIDNEGNQLYKEYDIKARELGLALNEIPNFKKMFDLKTYIAKAYYDIIEK